MKFTYLKLKQFGNGLFVLRVFLDIRFDIFGFHDHATCTPCSDPKWLVCDSHSAQVGRAKRTRRVEAKLSD